MLEELLIDSKLNLSDGAIALLEDHLDYVLAANKSVRLTAIHDKDEGERLHILDSLLVLPEVEGAPSGPMLDIGAGGGYPGLPLAVASLRPVDLLDSVQKKARVIQDFIDGRNDLPVEVEALGERAEELALQKRGHYAVVLARAVSVLPALLELASPLLMNGGKLIAHKGPFDQEELDRALCASEQLGMSFESMREYVLPAGKEQRTVYVFIKTGESAIELPRRIGRAQKKPLA